MFFRFVSILVILKRSCMVGFVTVRNEVVKVMFLHLSVILFTGGVSVVTIVTTAKD